MRNYIEGAINGATIAILACTVVVLCPGCAPGEAKTVVDYAEVAAASACIALNAFLPTNQDVLVACKLGPEFLTLVEQLVPATKAAAAKHDAELLGARK